MDPNATVRQFIDAVIDGDLDAAADLAASYRAWRRKGGFAASLDPNRYVIALDVEQDRVGFASTPDLPVERWVSAFSLEGVAW